MSGTEEHARREGAGGADDAWLGGPLGFLLRGWRKQRGISQKVLAAQVGLSARHLSFLETGRARPTRTSVEWIARALQLDGSASVQLLEAAGFASALVDTESEDELGNHREEVEACLRLLPHPALLHNRLGTILACNDALRAVVAPFLVIEPQGLRSSGHDLVEAVAPHLENPDDLRTFFRVRVIKGLLVSEPRDTRLADLHRSLGQQPSYPGPELPFSLPLQLRGGQGGRFRLLTSTLGAPQDVSLRPFRLVQILREA